MPRNLLFEIGTEEIPAHFLTAAIEHLGPAIQLAFANARLGHGEIHVVGTPRRVAVFVGNLPDAQLDLEEEMVGPPAKVAFDDSGAPTKAAIGFAERNGIDIAALRRGEVAGKKGEYLLCTRKEAGRPSLDVLPSILDSLVRGIPWPKSMRWNAREDSFVRPVHWLVAILGGEVVPLSFAGITAGRTTRGHRFLAPGPIVLTGELDDYENRLREAFVIVAPDKRRTMIQAELTRIEEETRCRVRHDPGLVAEVANLVEYPVGICGSFPESFLEVPEDVVVSAMRSHQRYFAMSDARGKLVNRFVTMAGTVTRNADVVRAGNERVLAARLSDAQFFYREDQKKTLDDFADRLSGVVFQKKLGTLGAKVARMTQSAAQLGDTLGLERSIVERAARLCKADLVSQMVGEFPDLQGTMGRRYAALAGEPAEVAAAIEEHYMPRGASDELPSSEVAAVLGVVDRLDTIVGSFAVGLAPSGSADPYGLRRAALGVLRILVDRRWTTSLDYLIGLAVEALRGELEVTGQVKTEVLEFLRVRLRGLLSDSLELPTDCVDAALAVGFARPHDARDRAMALAQLRQRADFEPLAAAFKRVANILKGQSAAGIPDPKVFTSVDERELWKTFQAVQTRVQTHLEKSDYSAALLVLSELKTPVDRFFDAVLVMDENLEVRSNRLAMLGCINDTFSRIADFRQLAV